MIGFYDYTVILTYLSLVSSIVGIFFTLHGCFGWALTCLAISGLLDTFDGKVARTKKNRTEEEKAFGIQIDSLCDMVCFGVFPVVFCWFSGMTNVPGMIILVFYCLAGLIRLAYYNVMEAKRQQKTDENRKYYSGLPITTIAIILPVVYAGFPLYQEVFPIVLSVVMLITGILFVTAIKVPKPGNKLLTVLIVIVGIVVLYLLFHFSWKGYLRLNQENLPRLFQRLFQLKGAAAP